MRFAQPARAVGAGAANVRAVEDLSKSGLAPKRLLSGDDLVAAGIPPSPALGKALQVVYDAQLEGSIDTFDEALALARAFLKEPT